VLPKDIYFQIIIHQFSLSIGQGILFVMM